MIIRLLASLIYVSFLWLPVFSQKLVFDSSFAPTLNGEVEFLEILSDGKILIVGDFTTINGVGRKEIARLNADGSLDESFNADWLGGSAGFGIEITAMRVLPDGKILVAGGLPFDNSSGTPRLRRLNADGSPDPTLTSTPFLSPLDTNSTTFNAINQLPDGKILICGKFMLPNGNSKPHFARYNNNGTYDSTFATVIDNECQDVEVLPDGKYYLSSWSGTINGIARERLVRFNADDSVDTSFNAVPIPGNNPTYYFKIKLLNDGKIIGFRATDTFERVAKFNTDGSLHTSYSTSVDEPGDIAVQSNGKTIVVSEFSNIFGQSFKLNRFNTDGTHDPSLPRMGFFGSGGGSPYYPKAAAFAADGKLIVGGNFTSFNFTTGGAQTNQPYLARFAPQAIPIKPRYDFDGDGKDDIAVFRPSDRVWYLNQSTAGFFATQFGLSTDKPVVADWDSDGKADIAVFRDGVWYWLRSSDGVFAYKVSGQAGDIPAPLRYSTVTRQIVFRPTATPPNFYYHGDFQPNSSIVEFRNMTLMSNDKPVVADYDGDGSDDLAIFRDGNWFFMASNNLQTRHYQFGLAGDKPVVGDFDGDLRADFAVYRPSEGIWYIQKSQEGISIVRWGLADDIPVPADYDGDGKTDIAVYRPSNGVWYQMRSTGGYHFERFGLAEDIPAQLR